MKEILDEIEKAPERKTLIFTSTKAMADDLTYRMRRDRYPVSCIHGDKSQMERDRVMRGEGEEHWTDRCRAGSKR